ncbi:TonB-dependent receptor [Erythrobacter sp. EC-HK427]|uniref:TonB-dependent receptor n=1 Tax=Erythrobacter sp. EC-HK427 TaxID=2038396 RepID=UPI00125B1577|nr:TonB-dependent receptor [Erythrobacter sp. EC-HK427]VVT01167.1 TonB-dependent receptor [Erythrobacter sp. EC-HK427]
MAKTSFTDFAPDESRVEWLRKSLKAGSSLAVVGALLAAGPAFAQEVPAGTEAVDPEDEIPEGGNVIYVDGFRAQLANSQNIKRESDTIVDAITAEDIGALPDRSVTEALQRIPGVSINRFAGSNDPDHFSVEGSGVVIRGLNFVRGEFNGRDAFSANGGRQLGFSDVPAELLGSVIVAKNVTAEMIEGGLAGTVNLNVRRPFDNDGLFWGGSLEVNYADLIEEFSPQGSLLISNTWDTGVGRFGLLAAASYSQVLSRSDGIQVTNFQTRDGATVAGANGAGPVVRTQVPGFDVLYAPLGGQFRTQDYNRQRYGYTAAAQWESIDETMVATLQWFRADSSNAWGEHTFESAPDLAEYNTFPAPGTTYQVDENDVFESGYITFPGTGWRTGDSGSATTRVPTGGVQQSLSRRQVYQETTNQDFGFNFLWTPNERWSFNFDAQYTEASTDNLDFSVFGSTFADTQLDISGDLPVVIPTIPQTVRADWAAPSSLEGLSSAEYFTSRDYTFWRAAMDHIEDSDGGQYAFRGDAQYSFADDSFLRRFKVGGRYSDRDQTVRFTTYNWGRLSEVWAGNSGSAVFFDEYPEGQYATELFEFPNFFRGATPGPIGGNYFAGDLINQYQESADFFQGIEEYWRVGQDGPADGQGQGWRPLAEREGVIAGTPFLPSDIQEVSERTYAAYAMLSFGNSEYAEYPTISGNIGVRFVDTSLNSAGSVAFPSELTVGGGDTFAVACDPTPEVPDGAPPGTPPVVPNLPAECDLGEPGFNNAQAFANNAFTENTAVNNYQNWLPSLNLRLELNDELQVRFAASRTMARPDFRYGRNFITIGADRSQGFRFQANAGNPFLVPATADQFDLSLEWYFDTVGSITLTGFYKSIDNFFYDSVSFRDFTNNGQTFEVAIRGPANYTEERGEVKGFELAYQQTFDFLPGPLSGLGFSGNYTFIDSQGIPNAEIGGIEAPGQEGTVRPGNLPLEQLSRHNVNATLFYEMGPISARAAYNWRSEFLLTSRDVIFPFYPVFNDETGQLDASLFISLTDNVKFAIQGTNLLNEVTRTQQQFTESGLIGPRSFFINDRRFSFGLRATF